MADLGTSNGLFFWPSCSKELATKSSITLSSALTGSQLFKALVQFLAVTNFGKKPCILGPGKPDSEEVQEPGPVIYDSARHLNITFKMSPWSANLLQQQAKWANALLGDGTTNPFTPIFITRADVPLQAFDSVVQLSPGPVLEEMTTTDRRGRLWSCANKVYDVLGKGSWR